MRDTVLSTEAVRANARNPGIDLLRGLAILLGAAVERGLSVPCERWLRHRCRRGPAPVAVLSASG